MRAGITAWLDRPVQKVGLDNLGTQQPCVFVYSRLLPGITNVTDRAHYFAFYPWFIRAFALRFPNATDQEFREALRRADCLLTLIAERHAAQSPGPDPAQHAGACAGRLKLGPAAAGLAEAGTSVALSTFADKSDENTQRYFKNALGGLGQYYLGQLRDEYDVLRGDARSGIKYTAEVGEGLAQSAAEGVPEDEFFTVLANDNVTAAGLDDLASFCPCSLNGEARAPAQAALSSMLLNSPTPNGRARRSSLLLLLDFFKQSSGDAPAAVRRDPVSAFLEACYSASLPSGPWVLPAGLEATRAGWALYARNEMMSIAWIALFKLGLDALDKGPPVPGGLIAACRELLARPAFAWRPAAGFSELVEADKRGGPQIDQVDSPQHEFAYWEALSGSKAPSLEITAALMVRLVARFGEERASYATVGVAPQVLSPYPLTLDTLGIMARSKWAGLDADGWLEALLVEALATHQRIAIRKMGQTGEDTLMVRANDLGYFVHRPQESVVATQPRLRQALQVLRDLGFLTFNDGALPGLTARGLELARTAA